MSDQPDNLTLEILRAIRADGEKTRLVLAEALTRLATIEVGIAGIRRDAGNDAVHAAEEGQRLDNAIKRIETIERRLELRDQ